MLIKCGNCEREIEIETELSDGQHVICPFCGEKTVYSRPKRIELPTDLARLKRVEASVAQTTPQPAVASAEPKKPVLKLNHEAGRYARENRDPSAERRIYMAEEHARVYEELKTKEERRKAIGKITSLVSLILMVAAAGTGYVLWTEHRAKQREAEITRQAEIDRLEKARAEEQERHRQAQLEIERKERERRKKEHAEAEAKAAAEKARIENEIRANKEQFFDAARVFAEMDLQLVADLPTNAAPGKIDGRFCYLVPSIDEELDKLVVCESTTAGVTNLYLLDKKGEKKALPDRDEFFVRISSADYLVAFDRKVYFHSKREKPHIGELKKDAPADLTKEFFGQVEPKVRVFDCNFDNLCFEVVFIPEKSRKVIVCDTVPFGRSYAMEQVRAAIEEMYPYKAGKVTRQKTKERFKRTVVFWDGAHIKKGVDGVMYVPRVPPPASYDGYGNVYDNQNATVHVIRPFRVNNEYRRTEQTRAYWESLRREAEKQDAQEAEFYRARGEASLAASDAQQDKSLVAYREKIDRIIEKGKLYFRAKMK